jgi:CubicO group peptidase (beta-lactamase class C family)
MSTRERAIQWGSVVPPAAAGMSEAGVKNILAVYASQLAEGWHPGSQLVILRRGQVVVDLADGLANLRRGSRVTPDTPFHCFSVTKPFTAVCIHKLIEEGRIDLDEPIAKYWPEFGTGGKETATIRHALLHQAGIPSRGINVQIPLWVNWKWVTRNVAGLPAEFPPGSKSTYHIVNFGFILGEVVRRVSGKPLRAYLQENFLEPLDLRNTCLGLPFKKRKIAAYIYSGDKSQDLPAFIFNLPPIRAAEIPAANLNSTARELAVFFQMLVNQGSYAGRQLLKPETAARALSLGYEGYDESFKEYVRWGFGFDLGGRIRPDDPPRSGMGRQASLSTFGHIGQNCCMVWADSGQEVVVSLTTNRILSGEKSKQMFNAISNAVWDAVS